MRLSLLAILIAALAFSSCTSSIATLRAVPVDVDALFTVVVFKDSASSTGCHVDVKPDTGSDTQVKPGWKVGWVLHNTCDSSTSMKLAFVHEPTKSAKDPVDFNTQQGTLLAGKVKKKFFGGCDDDEAPCGKYKYTITVGNHVLDPEMEIVY